MSSEMRERPFCGNGAWVVRAPDTRRFRPQCKKCGADLGEFDREANAVEAWNRRALLARTEAAAVCRYCGDSGKVVNVAGAVVGVCAEHGDSAPVADGAVAEVRECAELVWLNGGVCQLSPGTKLYTHPQDASGNAAPVLFGRDSGGDWYVDTDTKSICVDVDFDPARQLSLVLKQDGSVAWSIFVQEPDSSTTKATGPSVMNPGFYEALSYIAMQAKEAK